MGMDTCVVWYGCVSACVYFISVYSIPAHVTAYMWLWHLLSTTCIECTLSLTKLSHSIEMTQ